MAHGTVQIGSTTVDLRQEVLRDAKGLEIPLRARSFAVLRTLVGRAGTLVGKDALIDEAWPGGIASDENLTQCIHEIRRALGDDADLLKTVPRRGYRLSVAQRPGRTVPRRRTVTTLVSGTAALGAVMFGLFGWAHMNRSETDDLPVVAVLPFAPHSDDGLSKRVAKGLTDDVIADLASFPEFEVIAGDTSAKRSRSGADAVEVGLALGAAFVVRGSIQRSADELRISAHVVDVTSGRLIWVAKWDRPTSDLFAVQSEIASAVANRMGGGVGVVEDAARLRLRRARPENFNAYDLYLLGTEHLQRLTPAEVEIARGLLYRSLELDPTLARSWVELAHTHNVLSLIGQPSKAEDERKAAWHAAQRAVALDPADAEAHAVLGQELALRGEVEAARKAYATALRLAPNAFEILTFHSGYAALLGDPGAGVVSANRAIRLNPDYPAWAAGFFAHAYFQAGRFDDALAAVERRQPHTRSLSQKVVRAASLERLGRSREAQQEVTGILHDQADFKIEHFVASDPYVAARPERWVEAMRRLSFDACTTSGSSPKSGSTILRPC